MVKLIWGLLCKATAFAENGDLAINGEFTDVDLPGFPALVPPLHVPARFAGVPGEVFRGRVRIVSPSRQVVSDSGWEDTEIDEWGFQRVISLFQDLIFPEAGSYSVEIWIGQEIAQSLPLVVHLASPEAPKRTPRTGRHK